MTATTIEEFVAAAGVTEARFDAAETVAPLLSALFALHRRVRPYNRYVVWELEREPLPDPELATRPLLERLQEVIAVGGADVQRALFADVGAVARRHGQGEIIDSWGERLAVLRP